MAYHDWIECEDLKPKHDYCVWMYDDDSLTVFLGYFDKDGRAFDFESHTEHFEVTHWKPINFPEPPNE